MSWLNEVIVLCAGVALLCVLGATMQGRHEVLREHPQEQDKDIEVCRGEALWGASEGTWSVQPRAEQTEDRAHCSYNFLLRDRGGAHTDLFSVVTVKEPKGMCYWSYVRGGLGQQEKVFHPESDWELEPASQGSGHNLSDTLLEDTQHTAVCLQHGDKKNLSLSAIKSLSFAIIMCPRCSFMMMVDNNNKKF